MTWMAPLPTWEPTLPAHWVREGAPYISRGHPTGTGQASPGGYRAACGAIVVPYDTSTRQECEVCHACRI